MAKRGIKRQRKGTQGFNRKNSEDFLLKNRKKTGVMVTDSGLQYLIIEDIAGEKPTDESTVEVQQRITLIDGTIIADTYKEPGPATFSMKEAIAGYREGLRLMNKGSRYRLFIPPELAWGKRGAGNKIGPSAVLIIDARLVDILPK